MQKSEKKEKKFARESYTAASSFPVKILQKPVIQNGKIVPYHVQLNPTNLCNLDCSFCSCANRSKADVFDFDALMETMGKFKQMGCRAVTITGGGEPLLHPDINQIIGSLYMKLGLEVGLVTNGTQFHRLNEGSYSRLTWCRVSWSDDRKFDYHIMPEGDTDWAFSYVVTRTPDIDNICEVVRFANRKKFTHVRLVSDLLDVDNVPNMHEIEKALAENGLSDERVIYQGRKEFSHGRKKCLISLLKPVVAPNGKIYPCCGVQYAMDTPGLDFEEAMCMGSDLGIWDTQKAFNGSACTRCYYDEYNEALFKMTQGVEHGEFV